MAIRPDITQWNTRAESSPLDVLRCGKQTQALAASDPRQFTWLPDRRVALTVVSRDVADVRTAPLASGRVVLLTGDEVSFLDL